jgi:2-alkyl-3-oxoalkanoate reductase
MKVFVAGASGAMGMRLVPQLLAGSHEVVAMTRSPQKAEGLRALGAEAVIADALDRDAVAKAVAGAQPEAVIHQLTALTGVKSFRNFDKEFALTNRLRTEGTDYLLAAARAAGARRFVAQSYGNWNYERTGTGLKTEEDPARPKPGEEPEGVAGGDPLSREDGAGGGRDRGRRPALRQLLRPRYRHRP